MRKYYYKAADQYGRIIFNHKSDSVAKLLKMANKEAYSSDGNMYQSWYFAKIDTNITEEERYYLYCTGKI